MGKRKLAQSLTMDSTRSLNSIPNEQAIMTDTMLSHLLHPIVLSLGCNNRHFSDSTFVAGQGTPRFRKNSPKKERTTTK